MKRQSIQVVSLATMLLLCAPAYVARASEAIHGGAAGKEVIRFRNAQSVHLGQRNLPPFPVWTPRSGLDIARSETASAVVDSMVYLFGDFNYSSNNARVDVYDPEYDAWRPVADMPTGRGQAAAAAVDNLIYVVGGNNCFSNCWLSTVEAYDTVNDTWVTGLPPLPGDPRGHLTASSLQGKVYVAGGVNSYVVPTSDDLCVFDPETNGWTTQNLPRPRSHHAAVVLNDKLYLIGGDYRLVHDDTIVITEVDVYDPSTTLWSQAAPLPTPRSALGAVVLGGKIYVIGGIDRAVGAEVASVEEYDPSADRWRVVTSLPEPRQRFSTAVIGNTGYVIGGSTAEGESASVFAALPGPIVPQIVAGDALGNVELIDGRSGIQLAAIPGDGTAVGQLDVVDLNQDGHAEILVTRLEAIDHETTAFDLKSLTPFTVDGIPWATEYATAFSGTGGEMFGLRTWSGDFDHNGELELVIPYNYGQAGGSLLQVFSAADGVRRCTVPQTGNYYPAVYSDPRDGTTRLVAQQSPNGFTHQMLNYDLGVLTDCTTDGLVWTNTSVNTWKRGAIGQSMVDGEPRIWGGWYSRTLYVVDRDGDLEWSKSFGGSLEAEAFYAGNLRCDGTEVLLVGGTYGATQVRLDAVNMADGSVLWTFDDPGATWAIHTIAAQDVNGDCLKEIFAVANTSNESTGRRPKFYALDAATGDLLWEVPYDFSDSLQVHGRFADVDNDEQLELLVGVNNTIEARNSYSGNLVATYTLSDEVNAFDVVDVPIWDCNENGLPDDFDTQQGTSEDCNSNSVPDECEANFDGDELIDDCDDDIDGDGVLNEVDVCDHTPLSLPPELIEPDGSVRGDLDGDCDVDLADYAVMQNRFTGPNPPPYGFPQGHPTGSVMTKPSRSPGIRRAGRNL